MRNRLRPTVWIATFTLPLSLVIGLASRASATSNNVTPVNWSSFTAGLPTDADSVRIQHILLNANKYALSTWYYTVKNYNAQTGYINFGGTDENSIRPSASEALALAISIKTGAYDPTVTGVSLADATTIDTRLISSLAYRHLVNTSGGWGNGWQTAGWAAYAGTAGWLMWTSLASSDQEDVRKMVEYEANRFNNVPAPYWDTSTGDTQADSNGWDAQLLQLAAAMMPDNPNFNIWSSRALEYTLSVSVKPGDSSSSTVVNGKALSAWIPSGKYNINSDGTLINHNIVHPDYMTSFTNSAYMALIDSLAGRATPQAAFVNSDIVYDALVDLNFTAGTKPYPQAPTILSPGGTIFQPGGYNIYYPNGDDWGTDRRMQFALADVQAGAFGLDDLASLKGPYWEAYHAQRVLDMQARGTDGRTYQAAGEDTYPGREEWVALLASQAYLTKWIVHQGAFSVENVAAAGESITGDASTAVTYGGTWTYGTGVSGALNNDLHWTNVTSNYAQTTFYGTSVKWIGMKAYNRGNADVYLDGVLQTTVDEYAPGTVPQQTLFTATGLAVGSHTIKIIDKGTKNASSSGYYVDLDGFITGSSMTYTNDNAAAITYSGAWTYSNTVLGAYGSDMHWSSVTGNSEQMTFTGTTVQWIGMKAYNRGNADVYIDGVLQATVDEYAPGTVAQQILYTATGLSPGSHTIKIVVKGTKNASSSGYYVDLDAFGTA
jgi:hypothetical protein